MAPERGEAPLSRSGLSRVARTGSVAVPRLFEVETYPTVLQLTSTVTADLDEGKDAIDLLQAIFPCGSITGAPKIRAMEIIHELESGPRAVYCGAIGRVAPTGEAAFNVAIRTLTMTPGANRARIGLGAGIVADIRPPDEWRECLGKGDFLADRRPFDLIETMRFDPHEGLAEIDRHLARMKASAEALDFAFDRHEARNELQAATFRVGASKVRLRLSRSGAMAIEVRPLGPLPEGPVPVRLLVRTLAADDFRLAHKTSDRSFYDDPRAASGAFEVAFTDKDGWLTEGSFTSLFVMKNGKLATPPLSRGVLPGVLRARLLDEGEAVEADLRAEDIAEGFWIGNSVRGLLPARIA